MKKYRKTKKDSVRRTRYNKTVKRTSNNKTVKRYRNNKTVKRSRNNKTVKRSRNKIKQYGGANSDEENFSAIGLGPIVEEDESVLRRRRSPSPPEDIPLSPGPGPEPDQDPVPVHVLDPVRDQDVVEILPSAPPPSYLSSSFVQPLKLPMSYDIIDGYYSTPFNRISNKPPIMSNFLERPKKITITDDIKNKEVKIIGAHGRIKKDNWFLIPEGVKIITFSSMGCSVSGEADKSHLEPILELYLSGGSLFKDNDENDKEKTNEMDEILEDFSRRGEFLKTGDMYNYGYKLHKENSIFPETIIYLDGHGCDVKKPEDVNCGIITFNKLTCRSLSIPKILEDEIIHFIPDNVSQHIKLSELIEDLGKGVYILFTCRVFDIVENLPFKDKFYRKLDSGRHVYNKSLNPAKHEVLTFNISINEKLEAKLCIEKFIKLVGGGVRKPMDILNFFETIYSGVEDEIDENVSLNLLNEKYSRFYSDINDIFMLNKAIFTFLDVDRGLKLLNEKVYIDKTISEKNKRPAYVNSLLQAYVLSKIEKK